MEQKRIANLRLMDALFYLRKFSEILKSLTGLTEGTTYILPEKTDIPAIDNYIATTRTVIADMVQLLFDEFIKGKPEIDELTERIKQEASHANRQ